MFFSKNFAPFALFVAIASPISPALASETASEKVDQFDFAPNPAIWKLADEDTTIYLFGTIHMLPKDLKWRTDKFDQIVREVDSLVVETSDADFEKSDTMNDIMVTMLENAEKPPLVERVKPENQEALKEVAEHIEMPLEFLDFMPTWMVSFMVYFKGIEAAELAGEYGGEYGVEKILEAEFKKLKKPIGSIEDSEAIIMALSGLPDEEQVAMVDDLLEAWKKYGPKGLLGQDDETENRDETFGLDYSGDIMWAKGQLDGIPDELNEEALGKGFYKVLIKDRNAAWTTWLQSRLEEPGKILLAVGTGHLVGEDSVQKMLAAKGLQVERIQ